MQFCLKLGNTASESGDMLRAAFEVEGKVFFTFFSFSLFLSFGYFVSFSI
jgi:hypothetical protein